MHNFERARSTSGQHQWRCERMKRDQSLLTSAVDYGVSKLGCTSLKAEQMRAVESVLKGRIPLSAYRQGCGPFQVIQQPKSLDYCV